MREEIYGIIKDGKVYELAEGGCLKCDFFNSTVMPCPIKELCTTMPYPNAEKDNCFRFSQELTDKLNGKRIIRKQKRMCLRDKSKVCDLCHECDIDILNPRY